MRQYCCQNYKHCDNIVVKIINFVIRLLSKLWIIHQIVVKITNVGIRFFTKLEALHHGQCEGTIKVTGFCSFSNKSQSFLVRNNFAASSATNPNKFLVTDKHFHNVTHLYVKETDRHIKKSNKSTPISHCFTLRICGFNH